MRLLAWPLVIFGLLALLFTFALRSGDPSRLPSALIGRPAPSLTLPPLEGLSDGGKPVPGTWIAASNYAAWLAATLVVAWVLVKG